MGSVKQDATLSPSLATPPQALLLARSSPALQLLQFSLRVMPAWGFALPLVQQWLYWRLHLRVCAKAVTRVCLVDIRRKQSSSNPCTLPDNYNFDHKTKGRREITNNNIISSRPGTPWCLGHVKSKINEAVSRVGKSLPPCHRPSRHYRNYKHKSRLGVCFFFYSRSNAAISGPPDSRIPISQ